MNTDIDCATNMRIPSVAILLATFNGVKWLGAQVESILSQANVSVTIFVRDDGSTDGTLALLEHMRGVNRQIRLLHTERSSGSAGANFQELIKNADWQSFDYVAFSDQDDVWHKDKLHRATTMLRTEVAEGYSSAVRAVWDNGKEYIYRQNFVETKYDYLFEGAGQGCTFVVTPKLAGQVKNLITEHHGIASKFHYHDWLIYLTARGTGMKWVYDEDSWMDYRQHESNEIGIRFGPRAIRSRFARVENGWYRKQLLDAWAIAAVLPVGTNRCFEKDKALLSNRGISFAKLNLLLFNARRRRIDRIMLCLFCFLKWI